MSKAILQVEDSDDDARLLELAFQKAGVINQIVTVKNGEEAICYLKGEGPYTDRDRYLMPGVILLDLKLPGKSGFDVLNWMKNQSNLKDILVLAISGQDELYTVKLAYALGALTFLTKPLRGEDVAHLSKRFQGYWEFRQP